MSTYNPMGTAYVTFIAGAAIPQYSAVKLHSVEGQVVVTAAITDVTIGFAQDSAAAAGDPVSVATVAGTIAKGIASAAITLGDSVMPGASGKVATAAGVTAKDCGTALKAATADGNVIPILLRPMTKCPVNS
jgi:hypothetical protein